MICTMNRPEALARCLASLAAQTIPVGEVVVVHAGSDEHLAETLRRIFAAAPFELKYLRSQPSLVLQRNLGITHSVGDVVFLLDDDVVLERHYVERILEVYGADVTGRIGGVQGSITNTADPVWAGRWLRRLFQLTRAGPRGYLQPTGFPCHSYVVADRVEVELFSGCMMSFRRTLLEAHRFDERLKDRWWGDDWDLSYRVSREARLVQIPNARLVHDVAESGRDSMRRMWRMMVVNHRYLYAKLLRSAGQSWLPWVWAQVGLWLLAVMRALTGRGFAALQGMTEGFVDLLREPVGLDLRPRSGRPLDLTREWSPRAGLPAQTKEEGTGRFE